MAEFSLSNVQGDILVGLSKKTEIFFFFQITNASAFQTQLKNLIPLITTADKATGEREAIRQFRVQRRALANGNGAAAQEPLLEVTGVNIAFSQKGLVALNITDAANNVLNDQLFFAGQKADAFDLGDEGEGENKEEFKPKWDPAFLQDTQEIHGVILIAGDSFESVNGKLDEVKAIFSTDGASSITEVTALAGDVRPGKEKGHEHFGYKDGISQPAVRGVDDVPGKTPFPGQTLVDQGVVLTKAEQGRPDWAQDGSFLAFRKLIQNVPEFDSFLAENSKPIEDDFPDAPTPADILGARMVGRWKSGAPLRITPLVDDVVLADDALRNNKFKFNPGSQEICPFAAHIRKMNPRKDIAPSGLDQHLILRRGIPFGPEVTTEEKLSRKTKNERGLYFVSYQSDLSKGFSFLQKLWANNEGFPFGTPVQPGFDPIIGQTRQNGERKMTGHNDDATASELSMPVQWVLSRGGEYFFSPAISALTGIFSGQGN